jgi:hypothetical protein
VAEKLAGWLADSDSMEGRGPRKHSTTIRKQFVAAVAVLLAGCGPAGTKEKKMRRRSRLLRSYLTS